MSSQQGRTNQHEPACFGLSSSWSFPSLQVDSFSNLWGDVNEVISPATCSGRVLAHVVRTVVLELLVNYRYCATTRRLVKSPVELKVTYIER